MEIVATVRPRKLTRQRLINDYVFEGSGITEEFIDQLIAAAGGKLVFVQSAFNKMNIHKEKCRLRGVEPSLSDLPRLTSPICPVSPPIFLETVHKAGGSLPPHVLPAAPIFKELFQ